MTSHRLTTCLRDMRDQAEILYDTITVSTGEWNRWEKEITEEIGKLPGYTSAYRDISVDLIVVAERSGSMT